MSGRSLGLATAVAFVVATAAPARAQEEPSLAPATQLAKDLMAKADEQLKAKKLETAADTYERLLDHLEKHKAEFTDFPENQRRAVRVHAWYNMACARSLAGQTDKALDAFAKAVDAGWFDWQHAEKDEDLAAVRNDPRFAEILDKLKGTAARDLRKLVGEALSKDPLFEFDFEVTTLEGKTLKLSDLKGKTVVVDVWGTWCPPCREEIPHFVALANRAKEKGEAVEFVGLCWERVEPSAEVTKAVKDFVADKKIPYPVGLLKEKDPILERIPNLQAFPTTLWIDAKGKVRGRVEGSLALEEIDAITTKLASENEDKKKPTEKKPGEPEKRADEPF
jgi:thiol-disulfide isomerase/thioredoxin